MSASLVGSEMCIRDRKRQLPRLAARPADASRPGWDGAASGRAELSSGRWSSPKAGAAVERAAPAVWT
eukprot:7217494-Alexandrium_andersonii.AAC.1